MVGTSPILHRAQPKGKDRKYKKGEVKRDRRTTPLLLVCPHVLGVSVVKDLSACAELNCNLSVVLNLLVYRS